jgi:hypothetical protein
MKFVQFIIITTLFLVPTVYADAVLPNFSQYKIQDSEKMTEKPAPVDLSSYEGARTYRTKLREGAKAGPNFAGHYTIVTYGCGTQCQDNWVIDAKTGKIIDRFESSIGSKYQPESNLLIINAPDPDLKKAYQDYPDQPILGDLETVFKVIKDGKFETVYKTKWNTL